MAVDTEGACVDDSRSLSEVDGATIDMDDELGSSDEEGLCADDDDDDDDGEELELLDELELLELLDVLGVVDVLEVVELVEELVEELVREVDEGDEVGVLEEVDDVSSDVSLELSDRPTVLLGVVKITYPNTPSPPQSSSLLNPGQPVLHWDISTVSCGTLLEHQQL